MRCLRPVIVLSFLFPLFSLAATVDVRAVNTAGDPITDGRAVLVEFQRSIELDDEGRGRFEDVPAGHFHLQVLSGRFGSAVEEFDVEAGGSVALTIELGLSAHREKIVVTAGGTGRGSNELVLPVQVMDENELAAKLQPTLGETLSGEAGVSSTYFGPGASRPVIRGQSGGRVRMLEGGLGVGDASTTSPDHAVGAEVGTAERIEVLRGPGTLLYGSTAVGGLVNILDQRIPDHVPAGGLTGSLGLRLGSAADETSGNFAVTGGRGRFAWHVDGSARDLEDTDIVGRANPDDPDQPAGTLVNSALESSSGTVGLSWIGEHGFVGVSARSFNSEYGIPAELEHEEETAPVLASTVLPATFAEDGVRIDLEQLRYDLRGAWRRGLGPFDALRFSAGITDYEHVELEGDEVGTRFFNDAAELRFELSHGAGREWTGVVGGQITSRDLEAIGAEAFLPANETESAALFALEEWHRGAARYELGLRVESVDVSTPATAAADPGLCSDPTDRSFDTLSGSAGVLVELSDTYAIGGSISRAVRPPSAEELFSCGEHVATLSFEVGDPTLDEETALGLDFSLRRTRGALTGSVNLFHYRYDDYIYEFDTGLTEPAMDPDGLPVFRFTQADARFSGAEALAVIELVHGDGRDFDLELGADYVRAELADGSPLPRIPALRTRFGLVYRGPNWYASGEVVRHFDQDRVTAAETRTAGYTHVRGVAGYQLTHGGLVHDFSLRVTNLLDVAARNHASRLKDLIPLPGRDVSLNYRLVF